MYKTVTVWIESKGKKLEFTKGDCWLKVDDGKYDGDLSLHFDADGLRQFIEALEELERGVMGAKKEVKVKDG